MTEQRLTGDVVERQTYLNGTVYYLLEGIAGDDDRWSWSLAVTLPKAETSPITEGDFSIDADGEEWFADVASGSFELERDETTDALITAVELQVRRNPEAESSAPWRDGRLSLRLGAATVEGSLILSE